jgi:hypothetical protein
LVPAALRDPAIERRTKKDDLRWGRLWSMEGIDSDSEALRSRGKEGGLDFEESAGSWRSCGHEPSIQRYNLRSKGMTRRTSSLLFASASRRSSDGGLKIGRVSAV